ncbi:MAG: ATP-dependent DNA helicase, partial [Acetivibrio ethanolgignens]
MEQALKISVRNLVEFILREGDIDNRNSGMADKDAMQEGNRIHRKIQKEQKGDYQAEVPLSITLPILDENTGESLELTIEGRADGIFTWQELVYIDEIKGVYREVEHMVEPVGVHLAQAKCYAYMYLLKLKGEEIGTRMSYCNMETEQIKYFEQIHTREELESWFNGLVKEYAKWACWQVGWMKERNASILPAAFPFPYREGQKRLVSGVYRTILSGKKLFIEAPTGVGKTISTVFPSVRGMGEGRVEKLFYLTAKTITRTVAEDTFRILKNQGMKLKYVTLTAKEKICVLDKCDCNPIACERAKGHYDRVNDAVFDLLTSEEEISRGLLEEYAKKHSVCPFEMALDVTTWADVIICDYNYVFDPSAQLKRFFAGDKKNEYLFLIDEAHNLVERAREMYSAILYKERFLEARALVKVFSKKLEKKLSACNQAFLKLKRECDEFELFDSVGELVLRLLSLSTELEEFLQEYTSFENREQILELYFEVKNFLYIYDILNDKYRIYGDYSGNEFRVHLQCMDPSDNLKLCLAKGRSAIFFSATLLPIKYYMEQLGGEEGDYAMYALSPFDKKKRLLMVGGDVSTRYKARSLQEYRKIARYIEEFVQIKRGNYFVFFPSYQFMEQVLDCFPLEREWELYVQAAGMSEAEKEEFLGYFTEEPGITRIGFCVMGGIFGEGIDLKNDRLIGAVIVGTGLPMVCNERELFRSYYDEKKDSGFEYAYLYNGMNKVLQSSGRVIRTDEDEGAILLLDERFLTKQYTSLFPQEWFPYEIV